MRTKQIILALSPLLLFALLMAPYSWGNQELLVDWLGCGCPQIDEFGNLFEPFFNANVFTACFWHLVAAIAGILSFILSRRLFPKSILLRIVYIGTITAISLWISYHLRQMKMWK